MLSTLVIILGLIVSPLPGMFETMIPGSVIGMYGGQEDNAFYRRSSGGLEAAGGKELPAGDVLVLILPEEEVSVLDVGVEQV